MKILFTFENTLPNVEADAEVFVSTARHLAAFTSQAWLHAPLRDRGGVAGIKMVRAAAPLRLAALRHLVCGLTLPLRREFRRADLVYTRNLWVAWVALLFGQRVAFDHYRPWTAQIPPLRLWIFRMMRSQRFLVNICHSDYTRQAYLDLGVPAEKLLRVHNGFDPGQVPAPVPIGNAKRRIGVPPAQKTVVYTGRINRRKGLSLVIEAARRLPDILFILVGSYGEGPVEAMARGIDNIRIEPWQEPKALGAYIAAADILLIPPSRLPLAEFGSTVLPLKLFRYLASGRPILAGDTPDIGEILENGRNALLCRPDCPEALADGIRALTGDPERASGLAQAALADSRDLSWEARARRIAAVIAEKLETAPAPSSAWDRAQYRAWMRQSRRWLVHLIRKRSYILPPDTVPAPAE